MSLSVKHLNADTTFLLTFFDSTCPQKARTSFKVLIDPWLAGSSSIWTPRFQISHHVEEPILFSLADMPLPDVILISQDKPDHCHEETLRTLPPDSPVKILAVPAAARKIKSWKHFTNATIIALPAWNARNPETVYRTTLRTKDPLFGSDGELTISYIPQKMDMTNLHNAIGITYLPPSSVPVDKFGLPVTLPLSPPLTPTVSRHSPSTSSERPIITTNLFQSPSPTPPSMAARRPLSVLYSPHGIGIPCITPFMTSHLATMNALPLTALFHSINVEQNPWFLGGRVASGFPGGSQLVQRFGADYWLSAHDEAKDNRGWSTAMLRSRRYTMEEAQVLLDDDVERAGGGGTTRLVDLGVGEELIARVRQQ